MVGDYGAEMGFSFDKTEEPNQKCTYIEAIDKVLELSILSGKEGLHFQTAILSVRFVAGCTAFLSPQRENPTVMLELLSLNDTHGGKELMYRYQTALIALGGRPHWGLEFNVLTGNNETLQKLYRRTAYNTWKKAYQLFNQGGVTKKTENTPPKTKTP